MAKEDKPNLDLIQMVQQARMQHDADAKPSDVAAVYWIECKYDGQAPTPRTGQWILETDHQAVDAHWETIKTATTAGKLGYKSKVSTSSRNLQNANARTLMVKTADADDMADVNRVHDVLQTLLPGKWRYERD